VTLCRHLAIGLWQKEFIEVDAELLGDLMVHFRAWKTSP
jgi:hypothetical protein